jgi:hypothetical protein
MMNGLNNKVSSISLTLKLKHMIEGVNRICYKDVTIQDSPLLFLKITDAVSEDIGKPSQDVADSLLLGEGEDGRILYEMMLHRYGPEGIRTIAKKFLALADRNSPQNKVCPDCGDRGWVYDKTGIVRTVCPCHC